jgi:hypothetical protein
MASEWVCGCSLLWLPCIVSRSDLIFTHALIAVSRIKSVSLSAHSAFLIVTNSQQLCRIVDTSPECYDGDPVFVAWNLRIFFYIFNINIKVLEHASNENALEVCEDNRKPKSVTKSQYN